jgi:hypothetical protein
MGYSYLSYRSAKQSAIQQKKEVKHYNKRFLNVYNSFRTNFKKYVILAIITKFVPLRLQAYES